MEKRSLSVIIPALNEEGNIQSAIDNVVVAVERHFPEYELLIINDGSTDRTLEIAQENRGKNPKIDIISHSTPQNIGACYDIGRQRARMDYCVMIQGDNPFTASTLDDFFSHAGQADFLCGYWQNPEERELLRRIISFCYTNLLNILLHKKMRYYNGLQLHQTEWLKTVELKSSGFGYQAEVLLQALLDGKTYIEIPTAYVERPGGGVTKVFRVRNIINVLKTIGRLYELSKSGREEKA
jgi:dolichol-phosphate mannosyltransferase